MYISEQLHISAYEKFRNYLDLTYTDSKKVLSLSMGYPQPGEFPLPKCILKCLAVEENAKEKLRPGYGWNAGSYELRTEIIELENMLHCTRYSVKNICMVAGATYAFNRLIEYLYVDCKENAHKDFLIVAPTYYRMMNRVKEYANVISVVGSEENDFQITADELISAITKDTRAIFLANPTNPTYLYYKPEFFERITPILEKKGIYLIIDESGDAFNLGVGANRLKRFTSIIDHENIIRIVTASKKYLMAEYRIGYVLASEKIMGDKYKGFIKLIGDDIGNAPLATNEALMKIAYIEKAILCGEVTEEATEYDMIMNQNNYKMIHLKELAIDILQQCDNIKKIIVPDSNFNIAFKIESSKYKKDIKLFESLLQKRNISILPCSGLGLGETDMYFRLTYGIERNDLLTGLFGLTEFLKFET